jgi:RNA polymerase sigma-70 factor (ECF subfamily)
MEKDLMIELYETYYHKLVEYAKKSVSECDAEDLVQNFFTNLWNKKINPKEIKILDDLKKYAYVCIKNLCIDHIRHNKAKDKAMNNLQKLQIENIEDVEFSEKNYMQKDIRELIANELDKLSPKHKEIFLAHYIEELSIKEIAARFEIKIRTVESYLYRTLCYLKKIRLLLII